MTDLTPAERIRLALEQPVNLRGGEAIQFGTLRVDALNALDEYVAALDAERARADNAEKFNRLLVPVDQARNRNLEALAEAAREHGHAAGGEYYDSRCSLCAVLAVLEEPQ